MDDRRLRGDAKDVATVQARQAPRQAVGVVAAQRTIAVLGDVWTLRILRTIFRGKRRYRDFVKEFGVSVSYTHLTLPTNREV